jgi:hypothetical protein
LACIGVEVKCLPTIIFFPAGKDAKPITLDGGDCTLDGGDCSLKVGSVF